MNAAPVLMRTARGVVEYAVWGASAPDAPTVLALHGAMGGHDQSAILAQALYGARDDVRFIAVSRPGYLGTPLAMGATPPEQADLCAELLGRLGVRSATVAAVSGGGPCALELALRCPDRVAALVLVSACTSRLTTPLPIRFHMMRAMAHVPWLVAAMRRKIERDPTGAARRAIRDAALCARTLAHPDAGPLLRALQRSTALHMNQRMPGTLADIRATRTLAELVVERIAAPTLIVHGTADTVVPFAQATTLSERMPNARLLRINNGEHVALFTHLDAIRDAVRALAPAYALR